MQQSVDAWWTNDTDRLLRELKSSRQGLSAGEASSRVAASRSQRHVKPDAGRFELLWEQFRSPITLILSLAAVLSFTLRDRVDAVIILTIIIASGVLGYWQESGAAGALRKLLSRIASRTTVLRDGRAIAVDSGEVVRGDVVTLAAGSAVPADCRLLESRDLYVNEATLTGETYPVEKQPGVVSAEAPLAERRNVLYLGTHVVSGTAAALVVNVGEQTEFGKISARLRLRPPETDFERGIRRFGFFLMEVTLLLVVAIFAINVFFHKPVVEAFLFSLALAVGLTPQLLPAIISVNLSHGAKRMADRDVIVRRLAAIENFGSMNMLCADKTGTLTQGAVRVRQAVDVYGQPSERVMLFAAVNAGFESGFANPIDQAIREQTESDLSRFRKLDESPYDFIRKRLSVLVSDQTRTLLITKGALDNVVAVCDSAEMSDGSVIAFADCAKQLDLLARELGNQGLRTLGVAYRRMDGCKHASKDAEQKMVFLGLLVLEDPPKENIASTIDRLSAMGVTLKMVTGDNRRVAASVAHQVGLSGEGLMTGAELHQLSDEALIARVNTTDVFAEVEPNQKERIILACKKGGNVVGYMGDGINDATALHAADVGISVDQAVDVAREAADIVLLKHDLGVLADGIQEGRRTFANTTKYIFMATSANFGNMFSVACASLFLNFLPLLPKQILLMNLLTDLPEMTIARDAVDAEAVRRPQRWDIHFLRSFMLVFGTLSSAFDLLTFGVLLLWFQANPAQFRTAWFMESVVSATLVVLVVRTRRSLLRSWPSKLLLGAVAGSAAVAMILPWLPGAPLLGFAPIPSLMAAAIALIVVAYVASAELVKAAFYRHGSADAKPLDRRAAGSSQTTKPVA